MFTRFTAAGQLYRLTNARNLQKLDKIDVNRLLTVYESGIQAAKSMKSRDNRRELDEKDKRPDKYIAFFR